MAQRTSALAFNGRAFKITMSKTSWFKPARAVLLTGAGFSKDFGGFLASEMWAAILNQPQIGQCPRLRAELLAQLNFEKVYDTVLTSDQFNPREKRAFTEALRSAYRGMDEVIAQNGTAASAVCRSFLQRFNGCIQAKTRGFHFTLNQDLLIERFFTSGNLNGLAKIPGLEHSDWFNRRLPHPLDGCYRIQLLTGTEVQEIKTKFGQKSSESFAYIKLHGSYGWVGSDGNEVLVIGYEKEGAIAREPLLHWYFELFREVLAQPNAKLVVIGYGFRDKHVNDVIANSIPKGLRIYVVSPKQPNEFRDKLCPVHGFNVVTPHRGEEIWKAIFGYHCGRVTDFFQTNSSDLTPQGKAFLKQVDLV